jgi:predicted AAA+ superfamily ATPase
VYRYKFEKNFRGIVDTMYFDSELINHLSFKKREAKSKLKKIRNFNHREEYFKIQECLDEYLEGNLEKRFIVLPGLRGVGKTTILFQLYEYLLNEKNIPSENILYISMDQIVNYFQTNLLDAVDTFLEDTHKVDRINLAKKLFIFVDESHFDKKWAISGKIIFDSTENIFLICTGSSAVNLEITGDVARRIKKVPIFPNNFKDHLLLKHNINLGEEFSQSLKNLVYFGKEEYIEEAINLENELNERLLDLNNSPKIEFENFLKAYGFPYTLNDDEYESYEKIYNEVENIINIDIPSVKSLNTSTLDTIRLIIIYLALQRSGGTSNTKLAKYFSISSTSVKNILDVLEKTQLMFSVKPYGGPSKILKKPWRYYFLSPSLKTAVNFEMKKYSLDSRKCLGALGETLVGSSLFKMIKTDFSLMGLFYPPDKGSSDFLIRTNLEDLVPIEVGVGKKTKSQLVRDINKYNSDYGILVSNRYNRIKKENNIIHIPLINFGFI